MYRHSQRAKCDAAAVRVTRRGSASQLESNVNRVVTPRAIVKPDVPVGEVLGISALECDSFPVGRDGQTAVKTRIPECSENFPSRSNHVNWPVILPRLGPVMLDVPARYTSTPVGAAEKLDDILGDWKRFPPRFPVAAGTNETAINVPVEAFGVEARTKSR